MSLQPTRRYVVPEHTAHVAKAAFPKGALCLQIYAHLGTIFVDQDFDELFPRRGQPAAAPFRLALVTILQFVEGLSDRAAADAVRGRIDWKYLLCLDLDDPGFHYSVLCEFRQRLLSGGAEQCLLEKVLAILRTHNLVKARTVARTDSTDVLAAIRQMNRLERVIETLRAALNVLATVVPEWVRAHVPADWSERYGLRAEDARLPQKEVERTAYAELVGRDGYALFEVLASATAPPWLRELPAVETLRTVWLQNFLPVYEGGVLLRDKDNLPPGSQYINSPYDTDARYSKKRNHTWLGYKVHLTETCEPGLPHLITNIHTGEATTGDNDELPAIHERLEANALLPGTHLVDTGYVEAKRLVESRDLYGVDLFGPTPGNRWWQSQQGLGFDLASFHIDWEAKQARCPMGMISSSWRPGIDHRGNEVVNIVFAKADCSVCPSLAQCTTSQDKRRTINVRAQPLHEALQTARQRQHTDAFKEQYKKRSGIEGTISQGTRAFGLRRARYLGQTKLRLQHVATAVAMNLVRLAAWWSGAEPVSTRSSAFVRVIKPMAT
jgi:transposase